MLEDPRERELLKAQARSEARDANSDLARELELTDAEFERLIELLAEHELQVATAFSRPDTMGNDTINEAQALRAQLAQDIATLLGYEKAQQYAAFEDTRQVRTQVRRLRGRLSEGDALTDGQNQRLIAALQEHRVRSNEEIKRRVPSERVSGSMGTWDGAAAYADKTSKLPVHEQFMRQIEEYRKRQRQGAAAVLNARQLRVFEQMQDEMLAGERVDARTRTLADEGN